MVNTAKTLNLKDLQYTEAVSVKLDNGIPNVIIILVWLIRPLPIYSLDMSQLCIAVIITTTLSSSRSRALTETDASGNKGLRTKTTHKMLLEGSWRWKKCCCFTVQTGTTIIAILRLIGDVSNFIAVCSLPNSDDATEDTPAEKYFRQFMPLALNPGTKALFGIMAVIGIIFSSLLLHGNFKNIARIMKPAVYWWLACIVFNTIISIVGICQVASVDSSYVAPLVIVMLLGWVIALLLIQVIRCRIADVEEVEIH